jgi:hypothetical protein
MRYGFHRERSRWLSARQRIQTYMISRNNGGAVQPVSRLIDKGGEAHVVDTRASRASAIDLSIVG